MTVESESEESQNYEVVDHAVKDTPISDRGINNKDSKIFLYLHYYCSFLLLGLEIDSLGFVTSTCICDDLGTHLEPVATPVRNHGKFMKILKYFISHDYCCFRLILGREIDFLGFCNSYMHP